MSLVVLFFACCLQTTNLISLWGNWKQGSWQISLWFLFFLVELSLQFPRSNELNPFQEELTSDWHNKGLLFLADPFTGILKTLLRHLKRNFLLCARLWASEETRGAAAPPAGLPSVIFATLFWFLLLHQRMKSLGEGSLRDSVTHMQVKSWNIFNILFISPCLMKRFILRPKFWDGEGNGKAKIGNTQNVDSQWHLLQTPVGVPVQPGMCDVGWSRNNLNRWHHGIWSVSASVSEWKNNGSISDFYLMQKSLFSHKLQESCLINTTSWQKCLKIGIACDTMDDLVINWTSWLVLPMRPRSWS